LRDGYGEQRLALSGAPQVGHPDLVGVGPCGRQPQPHVRGIQRAVGQPPVGLLDGVDIGGVEQRHADGQVLARGQQQLLTDHLRSLGGIHTDQARQHPVGGEGGAIIRVAHQRRLPRRGPQHPGGHHLSADQAVDRGGLARTGTAPDHHQQRRVGLPGPGFHATQQPDDAIPLPAQILAGGSGQPEAQPRQGVGRGCQHSGCGWPVRRCAHGALTARSDGHRSGRRGHPRRSWRTATCFGAPPASSSAIGGGNAASRSPTVVATNSRRQPRPLTRRRR